MIERNTLFFKYLEGLAENNPRKARWVSARAYFGHLINLDRYQVLKMRCSSSRSEQIHKQFEASSLRSIPKKELEI